MDSKHLIFGKGFSHDTHEHYVVRSTHDNSTLGQIFWHGAWKCYVFEPQRETIWSDDCLADVAAFLKDLGAGEKK
jgi:predicted peptidase